MGLDYVELVVSIEQSFCIQIPNEVAARLETPGLVIDYIHGLQSTASSASACLSQKAFYRLRKACVDERLCSRGEFQPVADLNRIIPPSVRRKFWKRLVVHYDLNPAHLERPPALSWALVLTVVSTSGWIAFRFAEATGERIGAFIVCAIPLGVASTWLTKPWQRRIPEKTRTPAGMVDHMIRFSPGRFTRDGEPLSREQIAATVKALTLEVCSEQDYREDAHFVRDLGLD